MPRIRTVKPKFFRNEELFDAEAETGLPLRVAFIGLWTVADREGRFEWKPRSIKHDVLPYDDVDFGAVLDALATAGLIVRYEIDGRTYGHIKTFAQHQHVNAREAASEIPAPPQSDARTCAHVRESGEVEQEQEGDIHSARASGSEPSWRQEFDMVFWPDWPHKVGRKRAIAAFIAARANHPLEVIIAGRDRYIREKPPDRDWMNPATFLEDERFLDEPAKPAPRQPNAASKPHDTVFAALASVVERRDRDRQRQAGADVGDEGFAGAEPPAQIDHRPATGPPQAAAGQREDAGRGHREAAGGIPDPGPIRSAG